MKRVRLFIVLFFFIHLQGASEKKKRTLFPSCMFDACVRGKKNYSWIYFDIFLKNVVVLYVYLIFELCNFDFFLNIILNML